MKTILKSTVLLFMLTQLTFGYAFTYSGPSYITTNFGSNTASATFYFNYFDDDGIVWPRLAIQKDGDLVSGSVTERTTPSSFTLQLSPGVHEITFSLYSLGNGDEILHQEEETTVSVRVKIKVQNNFNGGIVYVDNTTASKTAPYYRTSSKDNTFVVGAIDQTADNYPRIWNTNGTNNSDWEDNKGIGFTQFATSRNTTYSVADWNTSTTVQANLRKVCNLTFTNSFNGISTTGSIKVNGTSVSAPTAQFSVVEGKTIQVEAIQQTYNNIKYTFSHWSDDNSTTNPRTITANSHANFTAVYVGTAIFTNYGINNRNLHTNTINPRLPAPLVTLYWYQHESPNVTAYKIRRGASINGETEWQTIATVSASTTSYTDVDFTLATISTGSRVDYDVLAYYSPDQTYSNAEAIQVYGIYNVIEKMGNADSTLTEMPAIDDFALESNYPNPFNPSTQISYQLPENSFVNLVVYNAIGQKVAELVNQEQASGKYTVKFDASNLPSGVYIYKLQAGEFSDVKKMLLTK